MTNQILPEGANNSSGLAIELKHSLSDDVKEEELSEDEKCAESPSYYMPYGGATSFDEVDTMQKAQESMMHMDMETDKLRGIIHNITMDDELDVDEKARAIQDAADDYRKRISDMSSKALGNGSLLSRFLGDKRRKKWPYGHEKKDDEELDEKAVWSTAFINNLPDSSFAYIESGGSKDEEGKTKPRSLRHFPYKDASGKVDLPHLRNALARAPQSPFGPKAMPKLRAAARSAGVGEPAKKELIFEALPIPMGFKVFKDKEGKYRWLTFSSNSFEDLDGEIFTTKALEEAVEYADESGERGPLLVFHVPSAEIGQCDFQAVSGRFLVESGTFDDTPLGQKAVEHFINTDEEYQVSIGYMYRTGDEQDGVYDWLQIMERSVLPKGDAANPWTDFQVIGGKEVDKRHADALKSIFGEDLSARIISSADEKSKELEGKVKFKEVKVSADEEGKPTIQIVFDNLPESDDSKEEDKKEEDEKSQDDGNKEDNGVSQIAGVVAELVKTVEALSSEVKALKESDDVKISSIITPRGIRPTEDNSNVINDEKVKEATGDKEQEQTNPNPALPYVMDLIGPRSN